ncbi:hypothetical protein EDC56_1680 [Sinobacterium caligoides]|uniref:3-methylmercaptopropionyl-CoA dehydrogenase n=1 Tax=Sinobacterium caligoides TaxID=933926 RepID=A0A3N2DN73_9GAMM|nr:acyl-CoA dehydrogenase C-terminal domain-containing protein [Sinobacterium caligoides]ROS01251.1 hypothetical protein EDC56_1680 [Sinobacterium caligoides]
MPEYRAPIRDIDFVLKELLNSEEHFASLEGAGDMNVELMDAILDSGAKFAEQVVAPLNQIGDEVGCHFEDGNVTTPPGYKEAFQQYVANGWQGLSVPESDGGLGLPGSVGLTLTEMVGSASWAWSMYSGLAGAPIACLVNGGSEAQKQRFLPKLLTGEWAGAMCLTEAHCGSDVGMLRTKAIKNDDDSYTLTGTKIFISGGEQDITDNIIHAILARVEGAPEGNKGISLFIAPKYLVNDDGSLGEHNNITAGNIEKKMGLKGNATCVMNYDGAKAYLLGEENRGLDIMFKLMNTARIGTAVQGLAGAQSAFQGALSYANERLQMRSLTGTKNPDGPADPIIVHPDVRRMLMTQKAFTEGSRALCYWLAQLVDQTKFGKDEGRVKEAEDLLGLLTPVAKAFCTETGVEVTNLGMQVFGGHGYIHEHGMEQIVRDTRISTVYEGTTGIQALDLIGRKVMGSGGELLRVFTKKIHKYCASHVDTENMVEFTESLASLNKQWGEITMDVGGKAMENADEVGSASVDYAMFSGYVTFAYLWAQMAEVAQQKITEGSDDAFYKAKLATARFYFKRILPRAQVHAVGAGAGADTVMELAADEFAF